MPMREGMSSVPDISVIVPIYRSAIHVEPAYKRLRSLLDKQGRLFEIIFIDDGSPDDGAAIVMKLALHDNRVRLIRLRKNYGQQSAIQAGLDMCRGSVIFSTDIDLPFADNDLSNILSTLATGADLVLGCRNYTTKRPLLRTIGSALLRFVFSGVARYPILDMGCGVNATTAVLARKITQPQYLYGEIKSLLVSRAQRAVTVTIHPQETQHRSSYNIFRLVHWFALLLVVRFFPRALTRYYEICREDSDVRLR